MAQNHFSRTEYTQIGSSTLNKVISLFIHLNSAAGE